MSNEKSTAKEKLVCELDSDSADAAIWEQWYFNFGVITFFTVILASIASSILMALGSWKVIASACAALPALATLVNAYMKFEERSDWWGELAEEGKRLRYALDYQGMTEAAAAEQYTAFRRKHKEKWPQGSQTATLMQVSQKTAFETKSDQNLQIK